MNVVMINNLYNITIMQNSWTLLGATDFEEMLNELDGDILGKLIRILSNCSDDFLDSEIDFDKMPGVKYIDVLNKLKGIRQFLVQYF